MSNEFCQYDYGAVKNQRIYGQPEPPNYELSKITCPVYLYYSDNDDKSDPKDIARLEEYLGDLRLSHKIPNPMWTHMDFIFALEVKSQINDLVIKGCNENDNVNKIFQY